MERKCWPWLRQRRIRWKNLRWSTNPIDLPFNVNVGMSDNRHSLWLSNSFFLSRITACVDSFSLSFIFCFLLWLVDFCLRFVSCTLMCSHWFRWFVSFFYFLEKRSEDAEKEKANLANPSHRSIVVIPLIASGKETCLIYRWNHLV